MVGQRLSKSRRKGKKRKKDKLTRINLIRKMKGYKSFLFFCSCAVCMVMSLAEEMLSDAAVWEKLKFSCQSGSVVMKGCPCEWCLPVTIRQRPCVYVSMCVWVIFSSPDVPWDKNHLGVFVLQPGVHSSSMCLFYPHIDCTNTATHTQMHTM